MYIHHIHIFGGFQNKNNANTTSKSNYFIFIKHCSVTLYLINVKRRGENSNYCTCYSGQEVSLEIVYNQSIIHLLTLQTWS